MAIKVAAAFTTEGDVATYILATGLDSCKAWPTNFFIDDQGKRFHGMPSVATVVSLS